MLSDTVPTWLVIMLAVFSGVGTTVILLVADQLRRWSTGISVQLDKVEARLGERLDATDSRVDDLEDVTAHNGERIARLEAVTGLPRLARFGRRRTL